MGCKGITEHARHFVTDRCANLGSKDQPLEYDQEHRKLVFRV